MLGVGEVSGEWYSIEQYITGFYVSHGRTLGSKRGGDCDCFEAHAPDERKAIDAACLRKRTGLARGVHSA